MWEVTVDEDEYRARLHWSATKGALVLIGALVQDVRGLTQLDKQLLKQKVNQSVPVV